VNDRKMDVKFPDFPYPIDAPFGWWSSRGLLVCGGRNWDVDIPESRCWRYAQCSGTWIEDIDIEMPLGMLGGASIKVGSGETEKLWAVGGGNGSALPYTFVLSEINGEYKWRYGPQLHEARYSHCGSLIEDTSQVFIIGGHAMDGIVESVEVLDLETETVSLVKDVTTPHKRWGGKCFTQPGEDGIENILMTGGMDQFFVPHANMDMFNPYTLEWREGPKLPAAHSGAEGAVIKGGPTLFGGFNGLSFTKHVSTFKDGIWETWAENMDSSRISGLAVSVPEDLFAQC